MFKNNSDTAVNEDETVGQNPWCQSDDEFERLVAGELAVSVPNPRPVVPRGFDSEPTEESASGKVLNTVLTSRSSKFIDRLLEVGADHIAKVLSKGAGRLAKLATHAVPGGDIVMDWIKDSVAKHALTSLVNSYRVDRERRKFVRMHGWGTYSDPSMPRPPSAGEFSQQVMR